jgi:EAL domain-containing protein (putative c-di-GMP-specific phosphodiesterase class I)
MAESPPEDPLDLLAAGDDASSLPRLSEMLGRIGQRFAERGAVGVLLIEGTVLAKIEERHGDEGRRAAACKLEHAIREIASERLDIDDLIVAGDVGRHELLVLLFRDVYDPGLLRSELPGLAQDFENFLAERGERFLYPYWRGSPQIASGSALAIRNPRWSAETQLRRLVDEARRDCELNARLTQRVARRRMFETILDQQVYSVYEPIVEVTTRTVFGYESLIRGAAGGELHSPMALFQAAEDEDLVFELDCLCRASGLRGAIGLPSGTKLFLNILPTTIHDPNFRADRLIQTLAECKLSPTDVVFEISEQESIASFSSFKEFRDEYRGLGFQFALDDTGAGYAGLETLLEISPEFVKVDRAFVAGIDTDPVRKATLVALKSVAETIGARIIGEGLDTLEELETLGELGIPFGQGWLFGKPTPLRASED